MGGQADWAQGEPQEISGATAPLLRNPDIAIPLSSSTVSGKNALLKKA